MLNVYFMVIIIGIALIVYAFITDKGVTNMKNRKGMSEKEFEDYKNLCLTKGKEMYQSPEINNNKNVHCRPCRYFCESLGWGDYCYRINTYSDNVNGRTINNDNYLENNKNNDCKYFVEYKGDKFWQDDKEAKLEYEYWSHAIMGSKWVDTSMYGVDRSKLSNKKINWYEKRKREMGF